MTRWMIIAIVVVLAGVGLVALRWLRASNGEPRFRTVKVERGDLVQLVKATGQVQPIKTVQVGTQVTGPVQKLYVDYNNRVKQNQVVAQIDPTVCQAQVDQGRANLRAAQANVDSTRAKLIQAEAELKRNRELKVRDLVSQSDLDTTVANRDVLAAQVKQAEAAVEQTKAALRLSETNLAYTTIRSPVDGVVIARNVDEGKTVVASFTSQTLFVIATDLKQMQVEADVPEADIGKIKVDQPVRFTVDAYPDQDFEGTVSEVRLSAVIQQNVVTYPVIIKAPNPDEKLLPTLTASVSIEVAHHEKVLKVPNSALRFKYEPAGLASGNGSASAAPRPGSHQHQVWVPDGKELKAVFLDPGISDGANTEVPEGSLKEGQEVVIGVLEASQAQAAAGTDNPFAVKMPQRRPH
jgi:HlyD family secretion protein